MSNHLEKLFFKFPEKSWNYRALAMNPNLTLNMINSTSIDKWDIILLARNTNIPIDFIEQFYNNMTLNKLNTIKDIISARHDIDSTKCFIREIKWNIPKIKKEFPKINDNFLQIPDFINYIDNLIYSVNPNYNIKILCENPALDIDILLEFFPKNIKQISKNPNLKNKHIEKYQNIMWAFSDVIRSPNIDIKRLLNFLYSTDYPAGKDAEKEANQNPNINFKNYINGDYKKYERYIKTSDIINREIEKYKQYAKISNIINCEIEKPDFWNLFQNNFEFRKISVEYYDDGYIYSLDPNFLTDHITNEHLIASGGFVLKELQYIPDVPTEVFLIFHEFFDETYKNIILTTEIFKLYPYLTQHNSTYENPTLTWEIIIRSGINSWNFAKLSTHPNINLSIIKHNDDRSWDFNQLSKNPNLTANYIMKNTNKLWDFDKLSYNIFTKNQLVQDMETQEFHRIHDLTIHELKMRHRHMVNQHQI